MAKNKRPAPGIDRIIGAGGKITYLVDIELKGYDRIKSGGWDSLDDAKTWRANKIAALKAKKAGKYVAPEGTVGALITKYIDEYSEAKGGWSRAKQNGLDRAKDVIGDVEVKDFNKQTVVGYGKKLSETRGPSGVQSYITNLQKVFRIARDSWDMDVASACNDLRAGLATLHDLGLAAESRKRDSEFQSHEIATLKRHLSPIMQDLFDALLILPFRVSELCGVRWKHFDQINRTVTIWRKDNDKDKTSYKKKCVVTLPVIEVGEEGHEVEVDTFDLLFGRDPKRQMRGPFEIGTQVLQMRNQGAEASRQFSWAVKLADLGGTRRFHDTRSNAMSNLFTQGFDVSAVCHLSGHTDWKMVQERYARLRPKKVHGLFKRQAKTNQIARRAA